MSDKEYNVSLPQLIYTADSYYNLHCKRRLDLSIQDQSYLESYRCHCAWYDSSIHEHHFSAVMNMILELYLQAMVLDRGHWVAVLANEHNHVLQH